MTATRQTLFIGGKVFDGEGQTLGELRGVSVRVGGRGGDEIARRDLDGNDHVELADAGRVRRDLAETEVRLTLEKVLRPRGAAVVAVEVERVLRRGLAA